MRPSRPATGNSISIALEGYLIDKFCMKERPLDD
jgi:hypothetical protein